MALGRLYVVNVIKQCITLLQPTCRGAEKVNEPGDSDKGRESGGCSHSLATNVSSEAMQAAIIIHSLGRGKAHPSSLDYGSAAALNLGDTHAHYIRYAIGAYLRSVRSPMSTIDLLPPPHPACRHARFPPCAAPRSSVSCLRLRPR